MCLTSAVPSVTETVDVRRALDARAPALSCVTQARESAREGKWDQRLWSERRGGGDGRRPAGMRRRVTDFRRWLHNRHARHGRHAIGTRPDAQKSPRRWSARGDGGARGYSGERARRAASDLDGATLDSATAEPLRTTGRESGGRRRTGCRRQLFQPPPTRASIARTASLGDRTPQECHVLTLCATVRCALGGRDVRAVTPHYTRIVQNI
jgi:hypothetical protein